MKVTLTHVPGGRGLAHRLGAFNHGPMLAPSYATTVFDTHLQRALGRTRANGIVCLELGPGESVGSALVARSRGAEHTWLVDVGPFASMELDDYGALRAALAPELDTAGATSVVDLLGMCHADYVTAGLWSLRAIPSESVDFVWSQAVLEHVRKADVDAVLIELRRVLRPNGAASHRVDLEDHLQDGLNNLRFSDRVWEAGWMASSGFYTNRLRYADLLGRFERAGFAVEVTHVDRWSELPLSRARMAPEFRSLATDDLLVSGFDVVTRPA